MREPGAAAFYLPWLDGLRASAALLVLVSHSAIFPGRSGEILSPLLGSFGVYVFLTLSAFLLTRLLRLEWQSTGRRALGAFWTRRALRIWPLYVVWCLLMAGWALWAGNEPALRVLGQVLAHLTFTEDFTFPLGGWAAALPYSAQLWTISLEEQAYFLLPPVLSAYFAGGGTRRLRTILIAIAAAGAAVRLGMVLLGAQHVAVWVSPLHPTMRSWPGSGSRLQDFGRAMPRDPSARGACPGWSWARPWSLRWRCSDRRCSRSGRRSMPIPPSLRRHWR